jgi:hypothetical protein
MTLHFVNSTIELLVVDRMSLPASQGRVPRDLWSGAGVYVLIGPSHAEGVVRARPGFGTDLVRRVRQHQVESPWFTRALLAREAHVGWNSAEARYLEGRLHVLCRESPEVQHDFRRDRDASLPAYEVELLERRCVPVIATTLELLGVPIRRTAP